LANIAQIVDKTTTMWRCVKKKDKPTIATIEATNHLRKFRKIIHMLATFEWA
jgi:hypothetical protein